MLSRGLLSPSLLHGVVRLLPKVPGVPTASQLRSIILLNKYNKFLTKMIVVRLLPLLPTVPRAQLCSVRGCSFQPDRLQNLFATVSYLLSLDFFHACDRMSVNCEYRILETWALVLSSEAGWQCSTGEPRLLSSSTSHQLGHPLLYPPGGPMAGGSRLALHLAYWLGISLQGRLPVTLSSGLMAVGDPPVQYAHLLSLPQEVFSLDCVDTRRLPEVKSVAIYKELPSASPLPLLWWNVSGLTWLGRASGQG
jgi:hypothetical protein